MLLEQVVALFERHQVVHALIGAAALAAAGVARSTYDIDLLTVDDTVLREVFWTTLRDAGVSVDLRRGDRDDPLAGVVRLDLPTHRPVDVIVGRHAWQGRALARANRPPGGPPVVTPADLVLLKLYAGGVQDEWDIRALLATPAGDDIARAVEEEIAALPTTLRDRWSAVRR
jgi:hypothetical protein